MSPEAIDLLLVEDSEDDSAFFFEALQEIKLNPRFHRVRDGAEALSLIFGDDPQNTMPKVKLKLVVLDLKQPKVSGLELLRQLKSNPDARAIPVVVFTSSQEKSDLTESHLLGANSYLVKPMDPDEFFEAVQMISQYWLRFNRTSNL